MKTDYFKCRHRFRSSARFNINTFTIGSLRITPPGYSTWEAMIFSSSASLMPRAFATRGA